MATTTDTPLQRADSSQWLALGGDLPDAIITGLDGWWVLLTTRDGTAHEVLVRCLYGDGGRLEAWRVRGAETGKLPEEAIEVCDRHRGGLGVIGELHELEPDTYELVRFSHADIDVIEVV